MKNIPVFTGSHGVATLVLKQIPWSGCAYVIVRSVWDDAKAFLDECLGFCRACGAKTVYAGYDLQQLPAPHAYDMVQLQMEKKALPQGHRLDAEPVSAENAAEFLAIYDACFRAVPHAASYGEKDAARIVAEQTGIMVKKDGCYAGLAEVSKEGLEAIAVLPQYKGLGFSLALTALDMVPSTIPTLKTASTNKAALALYHRLGFVRTEVCSRWWCLMQEDGYGT